MIHITQRVVLFIHDTILIANNKDGGKPNQMVMLHAYIICIGTWNDIDANSCMYQMQRIYPHTDTHTWTYVHSHASHMLRTMWDYGCVCVSADYICSMTLSYKLFLLFVSPSQHSSVRACKWTLMIVCISMVLSLQTGGIRRRRTEKHTQTYEHSLLLQERIAFFCSSSSISSAVRIVFTIHACTCMHRCAALYIITIQFC